MIKITGRLLKIERIHFFDGSELEDKEGLILDGFLMIFKEDTMLCFNLKGIEFIECGKMEQYPCLAPMAPRGT